MCRFIGFPQKVAAVLKKPSFEEQGKNSVCFFYRETIGRKDENWNPVHPGKKKCKEKPRFTYSFIEKQLSTNVTTCNLRTAHKVLERARTT